MDDSAVANRFERLEHTLARILAAVVRDELLTEKETAALRRKSIYALRKERSRRNGPPFIKDGGRILYRNSDLLIWLAEHTRETRDSQREPRFRAGTHE